MNHLIGSRHADQEQVHLVAVIEQHLAGRAQRELAAVARDVDPPRLVDRLREVRRLRVPPRVTEREQSDDQHARNQRRDPRAFVRCDTGLERRLADRARDDADERDRDQQHQPEQQGAEAARHRQRLERDRRHRHRELGVAACKFATPIRTCIEPCSISHRPAVKNCGSESERTARSGFGGCSEPGPVSLIETTEISRTSGLALRISIVATPGITCGTRIVTKR